jgi:hypothetical protein
MGAPCSRPTRDLQRVGRQTVTVWCGEAEAAGFFVGCVVQPATCTCALNAMCRELGGMACSPSRVTRTSTIFANFIALGTPSMWSVRLCSARRIWLRFMSLAIYSEIRAWRDPGVDQLPPVLTPLHACSIQLPSLPPIAHIQTTACVEYPPRFYSSEQTHSHPHATLPTHYALRCLAAHSTWSSANVAMK